MRIVDSLKMLFSREEPTSLALKQYVPQTTEQQASFVPMYSSEASWDAITDYRLTGVDFGMEIGDLRLSVLLMSAARWAGINLSLGDLRVVEIDSKGKEKVIDEHPFVELMQSPNPDLTLNMLWRQFAAAWVFGGEAYFLLGRDGTGKVREIYYEPSETIRPRWDRDLFPEDETASESIRYFEINRGGQWYPWRKKDVLAVYDLFDPITRRGSNGVQGLMRTLFTDKERETYTALLMRNFGVTPKAVAPKNPGGKVNALEIKNNLTRAWSGNERGKPNVFNEPMEVLDFGTDFSADAMTKIAHISESRVAAAVGISVQSLQFLVSQISSTYNNLETFLKRDYQQWIMPTHNDFLEAATKRILRDMDNNPRHVARFDYSRVAVMQPDKVAEAERVRGLYVDRIINQAEAREAVDYEYKPEQEAIWYPFRTQMLTLSPMTDATSAAGTPQGQNPNAPQQPMKSIDSNELDDAADYWRTSKALSKEQQSLIDATVSKPS